MAIQLILPYNHNFMTVPTYKKNFSLLLFACLFASRLTVAGEVKKNTQADPDAKQAVYGLIKRLLPTHPADFEVELIKQQNGKDVFELEGRNGKIVLRGSNGLSAASALNYYLKNYLHCDITWNGTNMNTPARLPAFTDKIHKVTPYQYRYYLNYCTFNYTMSWWNWERWQWEIDWMALNGINMPLAITGQNSVWKRVYNQLGIPDKDLASFFSGPAYSNWFWMGNLDGWGGPLPQSFMESQELLQKKILARERSFGMTPILPAFTGHVPASFKNSYPEAKLKRTSWGANFGDTYLLDPEDPMFTTIGSAFIKEEIKTFGTDHLYSSDTFNENKPPTNDSLFLSQVSKKIYQSMANADPQATWIMQGWLFVNNPDFWKPAQIKSLFSAVPDDKMIILDLWTETNAVWNKTEAYYGKPWIWCMLHNFGGNIGMFGRMDEVAKGPANALNSPSSGKLSGIGLTPEAIEQNPVMYELMLENVWNTEPIDLDSWLNGYALRRYGKVNTNADKAWQILRKTVYNGDKTEGAPESIITGRPTFNKETTWTKTKAAYKRKALLPAWELMISAAKDLKNSDGYQYDVVDLTRQVLADYGNDLQQEIANAYQTNNLPVFKQKSAQFIALLTDMDRLLATRKDFLLGKWLGDARRQGNNVHDKNLYEQNARDLITLWGNKDEGLHEYACKQWAGMLNGFYKPRWQQFFTYAATSMAKKKPIDEHYFDQQMKTWEWKWVNAHEKYSGLPQGNSVLVATGLYDKYHVLLTGKKQ
jgi:alpha-N-acetylglucosaminidase